MTLWKIIQAYLHAHFSNGHEDQIFQNLFIFTAVDAVFCGGR